MLFRMTPISIQIIGAPIACSEGIKDTWREMAQFVASKVRRQFGDSVEVIYFDLLDPGCPGLPPNVQLPLVLINDEVLTSGGKISMPAIRHRLIEIGVR